MRSDTASHLSFWRAAGLKAIDDRLANFRPAAAAIPQQEDRNVAEFGEVGAVDDRAAVPLGGHQTRARQDRQMRRERVLRYLQQARELASRKAVGLVPDQRPERLQPGRLRQGGEGENSFFGFHISRLMEMLRSRQSGISRVCLAQGIDISNILEIQLTGPRRRLIFGA